MKIKFLFELTNYNIFHWWQSYHDFYHDSLPNCESTPQTKRFSTIRKRIRKILKKGLTVIRRGRNKQIKKERIRAISNEMRNSSFKSIRSMSFVATFLREFFQIEVNFKLALCLVRAFRAAWLFAKIS